jgi:transcriptional regulator with XRE-family HTH domain
MDLVLKLRELRRLRRLTQKDVGTLTGVGEKTLSSFETGERIGSLKLSQLRKLLALYGITEEEFVSHKIEELFDRDAGQTRTRVETFVAEVEALPEALRDALLERFEMMLHAAQLAAASPPERRSTTPVPVLARPAGLVRAHAAPAA